MKMKQLATAFLALVMVVSSVAGALTFINLKVNAAETVDELDVSKYFYNQLQTDESKAFYGAMETMLADGSFVRGKSVDLIANKTFDESTAKAYGSALMNDFGAARDAFYFDHPDVFYVDFSALSLRATTDKDGGYHLYLGTGRYDTYYTEGFDTEADVKEAIAEYDAALKAFVDDVKANCARDEKKETLAHAEVEYAHDKLANLVTYKLEDVCTPEYIGFIRTAYGALVCKEGVCEAYTRAFKAVMDELGIPCVMVQGVYRHNDSKHGSEEGVDELHIWNYVYLYDPKAIVEKVGEAVQGGTVVDKTELKEIAEDETGGWYGVDVTMDDPVYSNGMNKPTTEYLLAGSSLMTRNHIPDGVLSEANYPFTYPGLSLEGYGMTYTEYAGKDGDKDVTLKIGYNPYSISDGTTIAGQYIISINVDGVDMGVAAANEKGYYLIMRNGEQDMDGTTDEDGLYIVKDTLNSDGSVKMSDWYYADPRVYGFVDEAEYVDLRFAQISWAEFGVTKLPVRYDTVDGMYFHGTADDIISMTEKPLHNVSGDYKAPPYPNLKLSTPSMQGNLDIDGSTYTIKTVWDDELMLAPGVRKPTVRVYAEHWLGGSRVHNSSAEKYCTIGKVTWDGDKTTTFTFKPSDMFMDDGVAYTFYIEGLVGKTSGKLPIELTYVASHPCAICKYKSQGIDWNGFGKPFLMENDDVSVEGVAEELKSRLALVATPTTPDQEEEMDKALREDMGVRPSDILGSETYNISLNACKKNVPKTGQSMRISLGFPEGYGPNDAGVTFKAYHFTPNDDGTYTVEEIPCIVTEYGLILLVDSFSPFEIAAVKSDGTVLTRSIFAIPSTNGGTITASIKEATDDNGKTKPGYYELNEGDTVTFTVKAKDGYVIDSISAAGENVPVEANTTEQKVTVEYEKLKNSNVTAVVEASFITATVQEKEVESGETPVELTAEPAMLSVDKEYNVDEGSSVTMTVTIKNKSEQCTYTYQWYRVDENGNETAVSGAATEELTIESASLKDAGKYAVRVTAIAGTSTVTTRAETTLSVTPKKVEVHEHTLGDWQSDGTYHWRECTVCGEIVGGKTEHTRKASDGYSGDCTTDVKCEVCGYVILKGQTAHTWDSKWHTDTEYHYHECTQSGCNATEKFGHSSVSDGDCTTPDLCGVCGYEVVAAGLGHSWSASSDGATSTQHKLVCTVPGCRQTKMEDHTVGTPATCRDSAECSVCHSKFGDVDAENHVGGTEIRDGKPATTAEEGYTGDTYCLGCGKKIADGKVIEKLPETHKHSYDKYHSDSEGHRLVCACGEAASDEMTPHTFGEYVDNGDGTHSRKCSVCGYEDREPHEHEAENHDCTKPLICKDCGATVVEASAKEHDFSGRVVGDKNGHYRPCVHENCEAVSEYEKHSGGEASCASGAHCAVCDYEYTENDKTRHTGGTEVRGQKNATTTEEGYTGDTYCLGCGELLSKGTTIEKLPAEHEHTFGGWIFDSTHHWRECACGDIAERAVHEYVNGVCTVCGDASGIGILSDDIADGVVTVTPEKDSGEYNGIELSVTVITEKLAEEYKQVTETVGEQFEKYEPLDIRLVDKVTKETVGVKGTLTISVPVPTGWKASETTVYYVDGDGMTELDTTASADGKYVTFTTDHLSIYVIVDTSSKKAAVDVGDETTSPDETTQKPVTTETEKASQTEPPKTGGEPQIIMMVIIAAIAVSSFGFIAMDVSSKSKRK